jgi:hypothetical protein
VRLASIAINKAKSSSKFSQYGKFPSLYAKPNQNAWTLYNSIWLQPDRNLMERAPLQRTSRAGYWPQLPLRIQPTQKESGPLPFSTLAALAVPPCSTKKEKGGGSQCYWPSSHCANNTRVRVPEPLPNQCCTFLPAKWHDNVRE